MKELERGGGRVTEVDGEGRCVKVVERGGEEIDGGKGGGDVGEGGSEGRGVKEIVRGG